MINAQTQEYRSRSHLSFENAANPARALEALYRRTLSAHNRAVHYDPVRGIRCGSGLILMSMQYGQTKNRGMIAEPMIVTGGNYSPFKGSRKHCGELNAKEELKPTDIVAALVMVIGPERELIVGREIEGNRPMHICLHNCIRCRGLFDDDTLALMYNRDNPEPAEALYIREVKAYHDNPDAPYPTIGIEDPKGRALEVLGGFARNIVLPLAIAQADRR